MPPADHALSPSRSPVFMTFERTDSCPQPANVNAYVWRFLDMAKFIDLLRTRSLYFCRGDRFDDPYEGMMPDEYVASIRAGLSNLGSVHRQTRVFHYYRSHTYINCWHLSEHEPAAMWKLYAGVDAGIAIQTTYSRLTCAFDTFAEPVNIGLVQYDPEFIFGRTNLIRFVMHKRKSFDHEKEVRAVFWRLPQHHDGFIDSDEPAPVPLPSWKSPPGEHVAVDLQRLLTRIVISPAAPSWLQAVITDVVQKYGLQLPVERSQLYRLGYVQA